MTKKSYARQMRDEAKKKAKEINGGKDPVPHWEELQQQYEIHLKMFEKYDQMAAMITDERIVANLTDVQQTSNLVKSMASDIQMIKDRLNQIYTQHAGKTGPAKDEDENLAIVMLYQDYYGLLNQQELLLVPVMAELNEHLNTAVDRYKTAQAQALAQANLQDPAVVSDVEATDVQPATAEVTAVVAQPEVSNEQ